MAHFTAAGFTFQPRLRNSALNKLKLSRPPEILPMHGGMRRRWRGAGRGERGGSSTLCWGDGGEKPREVPQWRENHVKATDGSLRGLCKQGERQMTECAALSRECLRILSALLLTRVRFTALTTRYPAVVGHRTLKNQY